MTLPQPDPVATLVVCEDDEPTLELLCDHLGAERFEAHAAPSITRRRTCCCSTSTCRTRRAWRSCARSAPARERPAATTPSWP